MKGDKLTVNLYYGEPIEVDKDLSVNEILIKCAENRGISRNSMKGFMLLQKGSYFIPNDKPLCTDSEELIFYRYVDYHTDRDCLFYIDNQCFQYIYHQYKADIREVNFAADPEIYTELCAMEILIMAMIFGDSQLQKPTKFIKHYKELTEHPLIDMDGKDVKLNLNKSLKDLKDVKTEYECMEKYIRTIDKNMKDITKYNRGVFRVTLDIMKNDELQTGTIHIFKEKMEILEEDNIAELKKCIMNPVKQPRRELHIIEFSDPKLIIKAYEDILKIDLLTQYGRYSIMFNSPDVGSSSSQDPDTTQYNQWRKCVALMLFYANLEYPRSRKEPVVAEIVDAEQRSNSLDVKTCPLIVPSPPIHYKLTRQDARMILKRYGTQDGWYMFNTFDIAPKHGENITNGELSFSYCMNEEIQQMTVLFSQEIGFGPPIYRVECFRGKKFCSLYELASHFSLNGKKLHTFITEPMVKDIAVPGKVFFSTRTIQKLKSDEYDRGMFYFPLDDKKYHVRLHKLPRNFWFGHANSRVLEMENMVRSLCDTNSIHRNVLRLFGICEDHQGTNACTITEDFGVCLYDYLKTKGTSDYHDTLMMAYQVASGLYGLHQKEIVHGFPVLHNCLVDLATRQVKLGGVGVLRVNMTTQRLDGEKSWMKEQPTFKAEVVLGEPRFHPARWLPKESLFDLHFTELTDRWCFGIVLWQMFNHRAELPLAEYTDTQLAEQLYQEKENWYRFIPQVTHDNKFLEVLLNMTIKYCLTLSCVDSIDKVVKLLDPQKQENEDTTCYTFANIDDDPTQIEDLVIKEINGDLWFKTVEEDYENEVHDNNYKEISGMNNFGYYSSSSLTDSDNQNEYGSEYGGSNYEPTQHSYIREESFNVIESINTIDEGDITLTDTIIGQGNFAKVQKGILHNHVNPEGTEVAVKIYHPAIKAVEIQKEIDAMTQLTHDFIIPLKGVIRGDGTAWLIMNFYKFGSLDKYIEQTSDIPIDRLCVFARQIAVGMQFLSDKNYIHRDLSTRNVLVQSHHKVRISDLGLSRSVEKQYYKHKTGCIPYLWYPPEFFETQTYGKSLDVWSYGITCYEIFNNAEVPYLNCEPPITDIKMLKDFFDSGNRLAIPHKTPTLFRTIITNCWKDKSERWTFKDIVNFIEENTLPI